MQEVNFPQLALGIAECGGQGLTLEEAREVFVAALHRRVQDGEDAQEAVLSLLRAAHDMMRGKDFVLLLERINRQVEGFVHPGDDVDSKVFNAAYYGMEGADMGLASLALAEEIAERCHYDDVLP